MSFLRLLYDLLDDILYLVGCGLVLRFVLLVWPVGVWLVAGIMLIGLGLMVGMGRLPGARYQAAGDDEVRE